MKSQIRVKDLSKLSEDVLQELPKQICAFYEMKRLKPEDFKPKEKRHSEMNELEKLVKASKNNKNAFINLRSIEEMDEKSSKFISKESSPV